MVAAAGSACLNSVVELLRALGRVSLSSLVSVVGVSVAYGAAPLCRLPSTRTCAQASWSLSGGLAFGSTSPAAGARSEVTARGGDR